MRKYIIILLLFSLLGTSCKKRYEQTNQEPPLKEKICDHAIKDKGELIREVFDSINIASIGNGEYYCIVEDDDDALNLFYEICGDGDIEKSRIAAMIIYKCHLPEHRGFLRLTCFGINDGVTVAEMKVRLRDVPDINTISFVTSYSPDEVIKDDYQRGTLSEIDY